MSLSVLEQFLPPDSLPYIESILVNTPLLIRVTPPRKTRYGSFTLNRKTGRYIIHISSKLNPYAFMITLIHEIAHVKSYELYGNKVKPHGDEWKNIFINLLLPPVKNDVFPPDLRQVLLQHLSNPKSSGSYDTLLVKTLSLYDKEADDLMFIEDVPHGAEFCLNDNKVFVKGEKLRRRYKCQEKKSKRFFLFNPAAKVRLV